MVNPMNHLDAALARSARRVEESKKAAKPADPFRFAADDHQVDGTVKPIAKPVKPPLGIMPRGDWFVARCEDLAAAIARYQAAGVKPPPEWGLELARIRVSPTYLWANHDGPLTTTGDWQADLTDALAVLCEAMAADPDYARTWHDNIAQEVVGAMEDTRRAKGYGVPSELGNEVADRIMARAFSAKAC